MSSQPSSKTMDMSQYNINVYRAIVQYKTSTRVACVCVCVCVCVHSVLTLLITSGFYSFFLPVSLGMILAGILPLFIRSLHLDWVFPPHRIVASWGHGGSESHPPSNGGILPSLDLPSHDFVFLWKLCFVFPLHIWYFPFLPLTSWRSKTITLTATATLLSLGRSAETSRKGSARGWWSR